MSTEEDKRLLARISQLAGQINRHKNQSPGVQSVPNSQHRCPYPSTRPNKPVPTYCVAKPQKTVNPYGSRPSSPYARGGGPRPRPGVQHRHRSLVLNAQAQPTAGNDDGSSSSGQQSTWISKTDRHLQLINSSIYEKDSQARAKAIAETQQQKLQRQDEKEKAKLKHFLVSGAAGPATTRYVNNTTGAFELDIEGIRFRVSKDGGKLVKVPGDINPPSATPKTAVVGGVKFFRSKTGNLYRDGIVKAHRRSGKYKVDTPCKTFSTTGNSHSQTQDYRNRIGFLRIHSELIEEMIRVPAP
ncbi:hypothetical protein SAPIO_CDS3284 [Scedosporium apiospermum]|uniref:Uncharacterized protein n=1 Tax=Pseudallescheria apiosperma TaxID=563466 RepID=A0A084GAF5_PSEDA|nr:uncharacterized protein SAPIO_CDS3284 [Scedosporium apiospermum]KEZ44317.1 hypothetical protein SAPIO_CDS3284 [Scedosporium apiospermum]